MTWTCGLCGKSWPLRPLARACCFSAKDDNPGQARYIEDGGAK